MHPSATREHIGKASGLTGSLSLVRTTPRILADPEAVGAEVAALVIARYRARDRERPFLLGCPGGRSLVSTYEQLAAQAGAEELDLVDLVVVMMDEYAQPGPQGPVAIDDALPHSCRRFGRVDIVGRLNAGRPLSDQIPADHLWVPDPGDPAAYEDRIAAAGGIDLFLLASGASDGHVAFNPPGTQSGACTRVVTLPDSTRRDNLATFPSFGGALSAVPRLGVTVGVATIRELSAEVVLVVHGRDKGRAAARLTAARGYEADWPATVVADCRAPRLYLDRAAAEAAALVAPVH